MKVRDIMSGTIHACSPDTNLAEAAMMMWDGDCGVIPVVKEGNQAAGMITDRDICIAVATRNRRAEEIRVGDVIGPQLFSCSPDDDVRIALRLLGERKVRRLPVVNEKRELVGILSFNDIILEAKEAKGRKGAPSYEEILNALKAVCGHRFTAVAA